jgi:orotidine-5'-phosphate decarboxylase
MSDTRPCFDRIEARRRRAGTTLCVGIDPRLERMPAEITRGIEGDVEAILVRFGIEVLDLTEEHAACWKPQIGFFEAHGMAGLRAFARLLAEARSRACPVVADVKRGDIGFTAEGYAQAYLARGSDLEVDAITVNPYLGRDALQPFVDQAAAAGKGIYVLVKTSNPGAVDLQDLRIEGSGERLYERTAALVHELGQPHVSSETGLSCVGAVVGATYAADLAALRERLPSTPLLVPGYGAQGATAADVAVAYRADGSGAVVNASRSVTYPDAPEGGWRDAVREAARASKEDLHDAGIPA